MSIDNKTRSFSKLGLRLSKYYLILILISMIVSLGELTPLPFILVFINPFYFLLLYILIALGIFSEGAIPFLSFWWHLFPMITGVLFYYLLGSIIDWAIIKIKNRKS